MNGENFEAPDKEAAIDWDNDTLLDVVIRGKPGSSKGKGKALTAPTVVSYPKSSLRLHPSGLSLSIPKPQAPSSSVPWVTSKRPKACVAPSSAPPGVWYGTLATENACGEPDSLPPGHWGSKQLSFCDACPVSVHSGIAVNRDAGDFEAPDKEPDTFEALTAPTVVSLPDKSILRLQPRPPTILLAKRDIDVVMRGRGERSRRGKEGKGNGKNFEAPAADQDQLLGQHDQERMAMFSWMASVAISPADPPPLLKTVPEDNGKGKGKGLGIPPTSRGSMEIPQFASADYEELLNWEDIWRQSVSLASPEDNGKGTGKGQGIGINSSSPEFAGANDADLLNREDLWRRQIGVRLASRSA